MKTNFFSAMLGGVEAFGKVVVEVFTNDDLFPIAIILGVMAAAMLLSVLFGLFNRG